MWAELRRQESTWEERLNEATERLQAFAAKLVLEEEAKAISQRVMKVLEAHNVKELIKNQYKI